MVIINGPSPLLRKFRIIVVIFALGLAGILLYQKNSQTRDAPIQTQTQRAPAWKFDCDPVLSLKEINNICEKELAWNQYLLPPDTSKETENKECSRNYRTKDDNHVVFFTLTELNTKEEAIKKLKYNSNQDVRSHSNYDLGDRGVKNEGEILGTTDVLYFVKGKILAEIAGRGQCKNIDKLDTMARLIESRLP